MMRIKARIFKAITNVEPDLSLGTDTVGQYLRWGLYQAASSEYDAETAALEVKYLQSDMISALVGGRSR